MPRCFVLGFPVAICQDMARFQTLAVGLEVPAAVARSGVSMTLSYEPFASSDQRLGFPGRFR